MFNNCVIDQELGSFSVLPNLPVPQDDGACDHLRGLFLPFLDLSVVGGDSERQRAGTVNLRDRGFEKSILFFFPGTGTPGLEVPKGADEIPDVHGCTSYVCGYRDEYARFRETGYEVCGISTQGSDYHNELIDRVHIPFTMLSDSAHELLTALHLPVFSLDKQVLYRRMVWIVENFQIVKVFYPIFPPDKSAGTVLSWLSGRLSRSGKPKGQTASLVVPHVITEMRPPLTLTNDRNLLQTDQIWEILKKSFWAEKRLLEVVGRSVRFSECYGILDRSKQDKLIAFARVVTDFATFAYLCDVIVEEEYRGQGLSKWIMETIVRHPYLQNLRRFALVTKDAHTLYERYGFGRPTSSETDYMEILNLET